MKNKLIKYLQIDNMNLSDINELSKLFNINITVSDKVYLKRSHFNESTLFYSFMDNKLIFSNDFLSLADELINKKIDFNYNMNYLYNYLMFQTPYTSETIINEINLLRAGEIVTINFNGEKSSKISLPTKVKSNEQELFEKLIQIPNKIELNKTIFHLSAGLDSSLLVLLVSRLKKGQVNTVSFLTLGDGSNNEIEATKRISNDINANHKIIDLTDTDIFSYGEEFISKVTGYPIAHPSHILDFIINNILSFDYKYIVSGKGPDDCLAGYKWHTEEYNTIEKHKKRLTVTDEKYLKEMFIKEFEPDYNKFLKDFNIKDSLSLEERLNYDLASISSAWDIIHNAQNNYLPSTILSPLNNQEIRTLMYNLPREQKLNETEQKVYLRTNFKQLYPEYILNMPKHGLRLDIAPYLKKKKVSDILDMIFSSKTMKENLNKETVKEMIIDTIDNKKNMGWQIWSLYLAAQSIKNLEKRKNNDK